MHAALAARSSTSLGPRTKGSYAWVAGNNALERRQGRQCATSWLHTFDMAESTSARVVISWSAKANAYVARDPARPGVLARGATLAEAARQLAAAVELRAGKTLLAAVDAVQREVRRKRLRVSHAEIAAEVRASRTENRRHG